MKKAVMGIGLFIVFFVGSSATVLADMERTKITETLNLYIQGTSYNRGELLDKAFSPEANLFLSKKSQDVWQVSAKEYASWYKKGEAGKYTGRIGEILSIEIAKNVATAKVEIIVPDKNQRFVDMLLLKKIGNHWKILAKTASSEPSNRNGKRVVFILSNAHFHGDSTIRAGASFSEIVSAYDTFRENGFTIDFLTPNGGAVPLAYINTSDPLHKKYLYDADFMYGLEHTKTSDLLKAEDYLAVHYVGGSNAMYGVAEHKGIQTLVMDIYEDNQGVVSSVCHGTAGLINLKTDDGKYLVAGKKVTGYPESFEKQDAAYFAEFPFLMKKTIEQRGGTFLVSDRDKAYVEVDGRLVTGQNFLSSSEVAKKIIQILAAADRAVGSTVGTSVDRVVDR